LLQFGRESLGNEEENRDVGQIFAPPLPMRNPNLYQLVNISMRIEDKYSWSRIAGGWRMRVVALVNQKGGSGKSTLAACLAVAAQESGERVFLLDMDPQKSLLKWGHRRQDKDMPVEAVTAVKLEAAVAALARGRVTLVIIDTPATDSPAADAAMRVADLCLIPARPTIFDIWASEATRGKLKTLSKDYAFLLNQCPPMQESQRVSDGAAAVEAMGGLLRPFVVARVDYQEAAREGMGVTEIHGDGKAAEEIRQLWSSLKRRLSRLKQVEKGARRAA
jgi:chromosome partitioning protein